MVTHHHATLRTRLHRVLARSGYSGKDMGVPFIKEKQLQLEMEFEKRASAAKAQLQHLADAAEEFQYDFLQLFHRDGPIVSSPCMDDAA